MAIAFGILGELQILRDGLPREPGSLRQRGLLARLIIRAGRPVTADALIDELWPADVPDTARHTLHVYISRLRALLGADRDRLSSDIAGYRLALAADELDATRFERLASAGRRALADGELAEAATRLRNALALWRGPALVEFADEPFAQTEAARLEQLRLAALEERMCAELGLGHHLELTEELRGLTLEQPFREVFWEHYMLALYRSGRQTEALHAYAEARTRLADDLGIEPGPALRRMEQRVLAHDPALDLPGSVATREDITASRPPNNLPLQRTVFVGRQQDLAIAGELLATSRLLTLTGAPGAGKTRLALRLATEHADRFPDGTLFVPLAGASDGRQVEPAIATALAAADLAPGPLAQSGERGDVAGSIRELHLLLLLDNLEQVIDAAAPIGRLLDDVPHLTVLATSRAPIGIAGEQEFPVRPLPVPPPGMPPDPALMGGYDAVSLLVTRARAADPSFDITAENASAIAGICTRLDGLPLAIELGAGRLRIFTPQDLLDRLERRLPLLSARAGDMDGRHHTLREAIAWSYELLTPEERRLFRSLAPFVTTFTAEAASAVTDRSLDDTWAGIESLLAQSLLYRPVDVGEARFAMLQTLREFGIEQLDLGGELQAAYRRHARFLLAVAQEDTTSAGARPAETSGGLRRSQLEEVEAALQRGLQDDDLEVALLLASATWRLWQAAGRISEGREWLTRLLAAPGSSPEVRTAGLMALAGLDYWQADYEAARADYEEALRIARATGDQVGEAEALYGLSMTETWRGDPAAGARLAGQARSLFEALDDRAKVGETLMAQGFALWQDRRYSAARPLWEEALAISRAIGADALAVTQLAGLAGLEFHTGSADEATRIALDALDQASDLDNAGLCIWLLDFIAAFATSAHPAAAVRLAGAADALRTAAGGGNRVDHLHIEPADAAARQLLSPSELERAWAEGQGLALAEAIREARALRP